MSISVIIPTFNRAALIGETLESVLSQTRRADEILVVDDGSTDNTERVVKKFGPPIRYIHQKNQFLGAARNTGLRSSGGSYLLFLDSDDLLLPNAIEWLEGALQDNRGATLAYGRARLFTTGRAAFADDLRVPETDADLPELLVGNFIRSAGCALIRRSALDQVGLWDKALRGVEDWDMWIRLAGVGRFIRLAHDTLLYRLHSASMSGNSDLMRYSSQMCFLKHTNRKSLLRSRYPGVWHDLWKQRESRLGAIRQEQWQKFKNGDVRAIVRVFVSSATRVSDEPLVLLKKFYKLAKHS
jgi:glycosyltransferase involved in cell wall biosynthesis